jgi:pimeloyl-ACP methyl ester carboxylesterase
MQVPEVRYARAGDLRLAYQRWGDGPPLMIIPDLISNVEITWEHELYRRSLEHLGKHMTCVYFDKRGIGASDRFEEAPTLEQRNQDILAVMDTVGWERAHVLGQSEGAAMGQLFHRLHGVHRAGRARDDEPRHPVRKGKDRDREHDEDA